MTDEQLVQVSRRLRKRLSVSALVEIAGVPVEPHRMQGFVFALKQLNLALSSEGAARKRQPTQAQLIGWFEEVKSVMLTVRNQPNWVEGMSHQLEAEVCKPLGFAYYDSSRYTKTAA